MYTHQYSHTREYICDRCHKDLTSEPRANCLECVVRTPPPPPPPRSPPLTPRPELVSTPPPLHPPPRGAHTDARSDLCLDCYLLDETSLGHRVAHKSNIVRSHIPPVLMGADGAPTPMLVTLVDALFTFMDAGFAPRLTGLLEPSKLSAAFAQLGVPPAQNPFRAANAALALKYAAAGCEYHLTPETVDAIGARATVWATDALDTTPREPSLTARGWQRWYVRCCWANPDMMHVVLAGALRARKLLNKRREVIVLQCPRELLPRKPTVSRGRGEEDSRRRQRSRSRPGSRERK